VQGKLYTLSELGVARNSLEDLGPNGWAPFPTPDYGGSPGGGGGSSGGSVGPDN
jgi:hypothetical protein